MLYSHNCSHREEPVFRIGYQVFDFQVIYGSMQKREEIEVSWIMRLFARFRAAIRRVYNLIRVGGMKGEAMRWIDGTEVGRNDKCPCGSGRKLKKCCEKLVHDVNRELLQDRMPELGTYVTASDLWPGPVNEEDILSFFNRFDGADIAQTLAKYSVILRDRKLSQANDDELSVLRMILPNDWYRKVYLWLSVGKRRTALPRLLILTAIRYSMLCHQEDTRGLLIKGNELELGPALLRLAALLEPDTLGLIESSSTRRESRAAVSASMYRNAFYDHADNMGTEMGRYWALLIKAPGAITQRHPKEAYDFNERYEELLGFAVVTKMGVALAVNAYYNRSIEEIIGNPQRFLLGAGYFKRLPKANRDTSVRAFKSLSRSWGEHVTRMKDMGGVEEGNKLQFFSLYEKPFVETNEGGFFPLDTQFVRQQTTEGIYWDLFDALRISGNPSELMQLRTHFGRCVEWYVSEIVRSVSGDPKVVWLDWDGDIESDKGASVPDAVVYEDEVLYFIEVTTSSVRPADAASGDPSLLRSALEDLWIKGHGKRPGKLVQLDRAMKAFSDGSTRLRGFGKRRVRRVIPVLVTLRSLPQFPLITEWYREIMTDSGLSETFTNSVIFMDLREVETIVSLESVGISWSTLEKKLDSAANRSSVMNYLIFDLGIKDGPRLEKTEGWMRECFDSIESSLFGTE